ncbi:Pectinesterase [Quillaja saponaria]|uniref:Pectinesterase n=1 Tax=Quillaja saponaria TaxID=32244 RepID=A0AAD7Q1J5_QUISA|nr:Pectinesterase [Quillaja saponaria]
MVAKVVVSAISLILVVGVVFGVVAVVHTSKHNDQEAPAAQSKAVTAICQNADDKKLCQHTLGNVNSTDPTEYIQVAVKVTFENIIKSLNMSDKLIVESNHNPRLKMSFEDCKDMMEFAVDQLEAVTSTIGNGNVQTLSDKNEDLKNWLTSVVAFQQTCFDGFEGVEGDKKLTEQLQQGGLEDAGRLTGMALDLLTGISGILEAFNLKLNVKPASRRLLGSDGYPTWLSASDRKLLAVNRGRIQPNVVVAKDGSGQFKTIGAALAAYPKNLNTGRYVIYVKAGVYDEIITVDKNMKNVLIYGDGPRRTIITGNKSFAKTGVTTMRTATFSVAAPGFIAKGLGIKNNAGPEGHQAVALRIQADYAVVVNCRIDGYQDTLYIHEGIQYYRNCVITGTVDFIFGDGTAVIQNSKIIVRRPLDGQFNTVTAQGKKFRNQSSGIVIQNCQIVPEMQLFPDRFRIKSYLGRPWKDYSTAIIMESELGDFIHPDGWAPWMGTQFLNTLYFAEYGNRGPGANTAHRVKWAGFHVIDKNTAQRFTVGSFIRGHTWLPAAGVRFEAGLR